MYQDIYERASGASIRSDRFIAGTYGCALTRTIYSGWGGCAAYVGSWRSDVFPVMVGIQKNQISTRTNRHLARTGARGMTNGRL